MKKYIFSNDVAELNAQARHQDIDKRRVLHGTRNFETTMTHNLWENKSSLVDFD